MGLNQLYPDQQVALMRADGAACSEARGDHTAEAAQIGQRILAKRTALGAEVIQPTPAEPAR